jgi:hypothetical protein
LVVTGIGCGRRSDWPTASLRPSASKAIEPMKLPVGSFRTRLALMSRHDRVSLRSRVATWAIHSSFLPGRKADAVR